MRKNIIILTVGLLVLFTTSMCFGGDVWVNGYQRSNGTYVKGHYRSAPDGNPYNNWSTKGNVNPYTGKRGYKNPNNNSTNRGIRYPTNTYRNSGGGLYNNNSSGGLYNNWGD